jgi:hypothetical protein
MKRSSLPRSLVALAIVISLAFGQETLALAGTTGSIAGYVKDGKTGAPIGGVRVQATSPSQTSSATTDSGGHFIIQPLAPDTYTITLTKTGYQETSIPGAVVFADQTQQYTLAFEKALKTIGKVTATAGNASLVKSGIGGDLYSVNSSQIRTAAPLGGGGNLNSAYSAMASVPGVQTGIGGAGWMTNAAYIRGQNQLYSGFEYDGIPVNRAFDNYNSSTESSLGLQELQVYTGGGPASIATSGISGFINQVIKTGTFPGYADIKLGIGTPTFYHQASVEAGGATPDRTFTYYVGLSGYNQDFRVLNDQNGGNFTVPDGIYSGPITGFGIGYAHCFTATCQGVKASCPLVGQPGTVPAQGCWDYYNGFYGATSQIASRDDVVNMHLAIPRKSGLRDDVQLLWSASALNNYAASSPNDAGPGNAQFVQSLFGAPYGAPTCGMEQITTSGLRVNGCNAPAGKAYLAYADNISYNLPFGTTIATGPHSITNPTVYYAPDTPVHPYLGAVPINDTFINVNQNDAGIAKLQYTHALSQSAFVRAYGYTFYSDWLETAPFNGSTDQSLFAFNGAAQYQLITHTVGGAIEFNDQLNDQHLLNFTGNYTQANVSRLSNNSALAGVGLSPIGYMNAAGTKCYDPASGAVEPCLSSSYWDTTSKVHGRVVPTWTSNAIAGPTGFANVPGASWQTLWDGNVTGSFNTVEPQFTSFSLSDQWRPNDKFVINAALRYANFTYNLPDSNSPATDFYANMTANYTCVQAATNEVLSQKLPPGVPPPANPQYVLGDCNVAAHDLFKTGPKTGWVHPNGTVQDGITAPNFTADSPSSYSLNYWEPRISATYTQSPDTVWRVSAGRFTQPPISASIQYLSASGDNRSVWNNTLNLGFYSPFHPIPGVSSAQYDLSLERHISGTDMSFKLTPFYTWVNDWQQQTFIGAGFVTQVPVGMARNYGLEAAFTKGDFNHDGLSALLSFTYTNAKIKFTDTPLGSGTVTNEITALNQVIAQYNQLANGAPCYKPSRRGLPGTPTTTCGPFAIRNPYYGKPAAYLDPNGWYEPFATAIAPNLSGASDSYNSPVVSTLILNYRHKKLAITPSFQFAAGAYYGNVLDVTGLDPRACKRNSADSGITAVSPGTDPNQCNYLTAIAPGFGQYSYLYIPNPQTGSFAAINSYEQPSIITSNIQVTYDLNQRITLTLTGTNLFHSCFGGTSEPWTAANPPSPNICGYAAAGGPLNSTVYPANFYNGTGIGDSKANGKVTTPYTQSYGPIIANSGGQITNALPPFNVYFNANIKL